MVPRCVTHDPGSSRLALVSLKLVAAGALGLGSEGRVAAESWNVANDFADERLVLNALRPP